MSTWWHIEDPCREPLAALGLTDFDTIMNAQGGIPVEVHRTHTIYRLQINLDGQPTDILLKREGITSDRLTMRQLLAGRRPRSASVLEAEFAQRLARAGITTLRPLAWGERSILGRPRQAFVIVEAPTGTHPLDQVLDKRPGVAPLVNSRQRRRLLRATGALFRRFQELQIPCPSFIPDRMSVRLPLPMGDNADNATLLTYTADLRTIGPTLLSRRPQVGEQIRADLRSAAKQRRAGHLYPLDMADLLGFLVSLPPGCTSTADLIALAVGYSGVSDQPRAARRQALERDWPIGSIRKIRSYAALQTQTSVHAPFQPGRLRQAGNLRVDDRYADVLRGSGLRTAKDVFRWKPDAPLQADDGKCGVLFEAADIDGKLLRFRLYRFLKPSISRQMRRLAQGRPLRSSSQQLLAVTARLAKHRVPCPSPVVIAQKMIGPCELGSFILFKEPQGTLLGDLTAEYAASLPLGRRRSLVRDAADMLRRFTSAGFIIDADPARHLLLTASDMWATYPWWIVGVHALRRPWRQAIQRSEETLTRLLPTARRLRLTRTDLWRFLLAYRGRWEAPDIAATRAREFLQQMKTSDSCGVE